MSGLKVTPMEGLRTSTEDKDQVDAEWKDFYSDGEEKEKEKQRAETKKENKDAYDDDFKKGDGEDDHHHDDSTQGTSQQTSPGCDHDDDPSTSEHQNKDGGKKGHRKKKCKSRRKSSNGRKRHTDQHEAQPPPLDLYHNDHSRRGSRSRHNQDAMSDQVVEVARRQRGRKLQRRSQMKKCNSMDQAVEQAGKDRLEQKFEELEDLLTRPLTDTKGVNVVTGRHRVQGMVRMHHAHNRVGHGLGSGPASANSSSRHRVGAWVDGVMPEEEELGEESQAYSTIRVLQSGGKSVQIHLSYDKQHTPASHQLPAQHKANVASKPPVPRCWKGSVESSPTSSSGASELKRGEEVSDGGKENGYHHYHSSGEDGTGDEHDTPRREYLPTDMHLKNTHNPKLQEWLRRKNAEYRRAKKAARAKRKEERNDKMVENELKIARREKSSERVKEWMKMKEKEAARRHKEERKQRKQEQARQEAMRRARSPAEGSVKVKGFERPQSAPANRSAKHYIPIQRPDSAFTAAAKLDHGDGTTPKPPATKFVYKRPVSGRVRLMKLQNMRNTDARNADLKRTEELTAEEKEQRARTSYDAWLITKRKEDLDKRKETKRQQEMIKSDPEMERIIPELAKRRIERIKSSKKRIDTGLSAIDHQENTRFGGADFGNDQQEEIQEGGERGEDKKEVVPKPSSYQLAIEGTPASLVEVNTRAKPAVAKTRMPIPQSAFSPRQRPLSAKGRPHSAVSSGRVKSLMETDFLEEPNPFKLPFPDDLGVPEQVRRTQEKIFSKDLVESQRSTKSERPEPQGCASADSNTCPKGVEGFHPGTTEEGKAKSQTTPRTTMQLLQQIEAAAEQEAALSGVRAALMKVVEGSIEEIEASAVGEAQEEEEQTGKKEEFVENEQQEAKTDEDDEVEEEVEDAADDSIDQEEGAEEDKLADMAVDGQEGGSRPQLVSPDESAVDAAPEYEEEPDDEIPEVCDDPLQTSDKEESQTGEQSESQEEEGDDSLRKSSSKHVSFSEDLTTVIEPGSTESSSNFDDERGDDDKGEMVYMSLDQMPDPDQ